MINYYFLSFIYLILVYLILCMLSGIPQVKDKVKFLLILLIIASGFAFYGEYEESVFLFIPFIVLTFFILNKGFSIKEISNFKFGILGSTLLGLTYFFSMSYDVNVMYLLFLTPFLFLKSLRGSIYIITLIVLTMALKEKSIYILLLFLYVPSLVSDDNFAYEGEVIRPIGSLSLVLFIGLFSLLTIKVSSFLAVFLFLITLLLPRRNPFYLAISTSSGARNLFVLSILNLIMVSSLYGYI